MDVLWLRPDKPDGISVGRHRIADELEARGHDVEVRNVNYSNARSVLSLSPDVIVGTTRLAAFVGAAHRVLRGTPLVVDHIDPISQLRRSRGPVVTTTVDYLERLSFRLADYVVVTYENEYERVAQYAPNVVKTSLGVDYELFSDPPEHAVEEARDALDAIGVLGSRILIYIGGLEPSYHVRELVASVDHLEGWALVVLGDGTEREFLEQEDRTRPDVHYLGTVPYESVPGYLHLADVGVSLVDDPNTLKVLEYGAAGLPAVQVRGAAEERFGDRVTYCTTDPADIASAVERAAAAGETSLDELASQHRWAAIADDYEAAIDGAVARRSGRRRW